MATLGTTPNAPRIAETQGSNVLPDPRSPSPSTPLSRSDSTVSDRHPDLSGELATLNTKLVNAINYQTNLDDSLQAARHELMIARQHIAHLEMATQKHQELVSGGLLIKKPDVDTLKRNHEVEVKQLHNQRTEELKQCQKEWETEKKAAQREWTAERRQLIHSHADERKLRSKVEKEMKVMENTLAKEQKMRALAEQERRNMEQELEALTAALFEEANGMVVEARKETEASEKRVEQVKNQLKDAEVLLRSHQEQLQDLKAVVERISSERDDSESNAHISTAPSTPGALVQDKMSRLFETSTPTPSIDDVPPDQPLKFSHLINPVLRHDLTAFEDFKQLAKAAAKAAPAPSRVVSGSFGSINVMGLVTGSNKTSSHPTPTTLSFPSTVGVNTMARDANGSNLPALKDTSVYKRALAEDIEPTLRLDFAPGVNWMAKRTIMSCIASGNLVVEPMPFAPSKFRGPIFACALCGENRKPDAYARKHRFRTSEAEEAQRYPLCDPCLGRVRMSCDYTAFLRMIRDGHWRAETEEEIKTAWEESVRLRERMFWQRIGGGVVPVNLPCKESPRGLTFPRPLGRSSEESQRAFHTTDAVEDPFRAETSTKRVSIGQTVISPSKLNGKGSSEFVPRSPDFDDEAESQLRNEMDNSAIPQSSGSAPDTGASSQSQVAADSAFTTPVETPSKEMQRLSLSIPGSFT